MLPSSSTMRIRVFELEWELLSKDPPTGRCVATQVANLWPLSIQIQIMRIWFTSPGLLLITKGQLRDGHNANAYRLLYCNSNKWNSGTHMLGREGGLLCSNLGAAHWDESAKGAAPAQLAIYAKRTVVCLHDAAGDGQTEAEAPVVAAVEGLGLGNRDQTRLASPDLSEFIKNQLLIFGRDADARVLNRKGERTGFST